MKAAARAEPAERFAEHRYVEVHAPLQRFAWRLQAAHRLRQIGETAQAIRGTLHHLVQVYGFGIAPQRLHGRGVDRRDAQPGADLHLQDPDARRVES